MTYETILTELEPEIPKGVYFKWESIVDGIIKNQKTTHLTNTEEIDLATLKSNLKIAKAEAKAKGIKTKDMFGVIPESCLITHNSEGKKNAVFNADYVIKACEMLGGKEWKITTNYRKSGAVIEGENGICIVMPLNHKEWVEVE